MQEKLTERFGDRLQRAREKKRLSQTQVAEYCGKKGHQAVVNWESGHNFPELDAAVIVAGLLGVSLDYLVWGEDMPGNVAARIRKIPTVLRDSLISRLHEEIDKTEEVANRLPKEMRDPDIVGDKDARLIGWSAANKRNPPKPPGKKAKTSGGTQ